MAYVKVNPEMISMFLTRMPAQIEVTGTMDCEDDCIFTIVGPGIDPKAEYQLVFHTTPTVSVASMERIK